MLPTNIIGKPVLTYVLNDDNEEKPVLGLITKMDVGFVNSYHIQWVNGESKWYNESGIKRFLVQLRVRKNLPHDP